MFILAYTKISKSFLFKTFYVIILQTVLLTIIPVLKQPILDDKIALCLISACVCGFGVGTILRASGSSGGTDILGMFFVSKFPNFSVGKLSIIINSCVYAICMVLFDYKVAIYSVILMLIQATVVDHVHIQNVNSLAFVITKDKNMPQVILEKLHRGVTTWNGEGCYTHSDVLVFLTVISKHQIHTLKQIIKDNDPHGFMVTIDHTNIMGNFKKRLD
ncbi:MAG: YitT family protein [Oscillospiraceae bacterium]